MSTVLGSTAVLSFTGTAPGVFLRTALAGQPEAGGRILVVVQLTGGNDGLNTIVPHSHDVYRQQRKTLAIKAADALTIDKQYGFHPEMNGFAGLLEAGHLAIVPAAGYPNPNRSHFESMDIWHSCRRKTQTRETGWLGHYLESSGADELGGMHIGSEKQPLALAARNLRLPSIESLQQFRLETGGSTRLGRILEDALASQTAPQEASNDLLGFLTSSTQSAIAVNKRLEALRRAEPGQNVFPETQLGRRLGTVSRLIRANLPTRVFYVTLNGFDTHARQANGHASLVRQLSDAVTALIHDLDKSGDADRVLVMSFSEFGRRVAENASEGTDHGTAGPVFLAGKSVTAGFVAPHADLNRLEDGDLRFRTDFRSVYAEILLNWFGAKDADSILGGRFKPLPFLKAATA